LAKQPPAKQSPALKVGDIVQLKSGGPKMTVDDPVNRFNQKVVCHWFAGGKLNSGQFERETLNLVTGDEED
jgi:uncharacterized protein YodC (DUF2158 family)